MTYLGKRVVRNRTRSFVRLVGVGIVLAVAGAQKISGEQPASAAKDSSGVTHVEFFVSPNGNDAWSGRLSDPSATDLRVHTITSGSWICPLLRVGSESSGCIRSMGRSSAQNLLQAGTNGCRRPRSAVKRSFISGHL